MSNTSEPKQQAYFYELKLTLYSLNTDKLNGVKLCHTPSGIYCYTTKQLKDETLASNYSGTLNALKEMLILNDFEVNW